MKDTIILASSSPRRKELLQQIGIRFEIMPSLCEEFMESRIPSEVVTELAVQKAEDVVKRIRESWRIVLGADTVVAYGNVILGKPTDKEDAYRMIEMLAGKEHHVYTGVCLCYLDGKGQIVSHSFHEKTSVFVDDMSREEIEAYLEGRRLYSKKENLLKDLSCKTQGSMGNENKPIYEWEDKAGAYGIQGTFAAFIKEIKGDYNNVVGLPIARVYKELKAIWKEWEGDDLCMNMMRQY